MLALQIGNARHLATSRRVVSYAWSGASRRCCFCSWANSNNNCINRANTALSNNKYVENRKMASFLHKISKSCHVFSKVVLLFDTQSRSDFLAAHWPALLENGSPVDLNESSPVLLDEVVLVEPSPLLVGLLLLEVDGSDVDFALNLRRMLFPPLL